MEPRGPNAADGEPAGLSVVVGDTIPYQPWAATQQQENYEHRLTADPVRQCFLPGVPAHHVHALPVSDDSDAGPYGDHV